jgi:hypothetical protein
MQGRLRHEIVRALFHAELVDEAQANRVIDTELTRAAGRSVSNIDQLAKTGDEYDEGDFVTKKSSQTEQKSASTKRKKARKGERKRKTAARRRK